MSANNQILIKEYKGRWYVFDVMAESWSNERGGENELSVKDALKSFDSKIEAMEYALTKTFDTEYGVFENELAKDGAEVKIIE